VHPLGAKRVIAPDVAQGYDRCVAHAIASRLSVSEIGKEAARYAG
jgi:hypothetical protein